MEKRGRKKSRNAELLKDFTKYCQDYPDQRFWQALRNWAGVGFVSISNGVDDMKDTYYWEGKTK